MPAPQSSVLKQLAKSLFRSKGIKMPVNWQQPTGDPNAKQYSDAFKPEERAVAPNPMKLFVPASVNKYHVAAVNKTSDELEEFIDGICDAICSAWSQWQTASTLVGVVINGPTASVGQLVGPPMFPLIMATAPKSKPNHAKYSNAVAQAISLGWLSWQASVKVPGLPWYPAFAAFPSPVAPPMPNVPIPLVALTQVAQPLSQSALKPIMVATLGDPMAQHHEPLFDSIAGAFEKVFQMWQPSTIVNNVLGTGPVPTFAPPYVPVGPVVGGVGNMIPGGLT